MKRSNPIFGNNQVFQHKLNISRITNLFTRKHHVIDSARIICSGHLRSVLMNDPEPPSVSHPSIPYFPLLSSVILNWCVSLFLPVNPSRSPTPSARRCVETSRMTRPKQKPSAASASPSPACSPTNTHTHTHTRVGLTSGCV